MVTILHVDEGDMRALRGEGSVITSVPMDDASGLERGDEVTLASDDERVQALVLWVREDGAEMGGQVRMSFEVF